MVLAGVFRPGAAIVGRRPVSAPVCCVIRCVEFTAIILTATPNQSEVPPNFANAPQCGSRRLPHDGDRACRQLQEDLMLTISFEKLAFIITKAREFDVEVPSVDEDSGSNPTDDADRDVLESTGDNPTYQELVDALNSLNDPERIELLALTWVGRGDYSKEEWLEALEEASRIHDEKETDYLIGTPLLADYLEEGLSQLGYSIEDL
jgi:hypothetical protein